MRLTGTLQAEDGSSVIVDMNVKTIDGGHKVATGSLEPKAPEPTPKPQQEQQPPVQ